MERWARRNFLEGEMGLGIHLPIATERGREREEEGNNNTKQQKESEREVRGSGRRGGIWALFLFSRCLSLHSFISLNELYPCFPLLPLPFSRYILSHTLPLYVIHTHTQLHFFFFFFIYLFPYSLSLLLYHDKVTQERYTRARETQHLGCGAEGAV